MTHLLRFDDLQAIFHHSIAHLPDHRKPSPNTRYTIQDAVLGAFGIFFTQSPSFLEYQRRLQHTQGRNNAQTLLGVEQIPCDNQVRTLLDPIAPSYLEPVFEEIFKGLEQHRLFDHFRVLGDHLLVALDGTTYFSSKTIHCPNCLTRQLTNGQTLYYHTAITPVIVCPGRPDVIALPPEYIMPQDGEAKQDCEQQAGQRWLSKHAQAVAPHQIPDHRIAAREHSAGFRVIRSRHADTEERVGGKRRPSKEPPPGEPSLDCDEPTAIRVGPWWDVLPAFRAGRSVVAAGTIAVEACGSRHSSS